MPQVRVLSPRPKKTKVLKYLCLFFVKFEAGLELVEVFPLRKASGGCFLGKKQFAYFPYQTVRIKQVFSKLNIFGVTVRE